MAVVSLRCQRPGCVVTAFTDDEEEATMTAKMWSIEVSLTEDSETTSAHAALKVGEQAFDGYGIARRNPKDPEIPQIGEELAVARALSDLQYQLVHTAVAAIEAFEGHRVTLNG